MLSYRHSFHAGNFADVLKHIVLVEILEYLTRKDKAFTYIDTHSGAGLYNLNSEHATKRAEWKDGIAKLRPDRWPELVNYLDAVLAHNPQETIDFYPGSPLFAQQRMRSQDQAHLFELHSSDFPLLKQAIGPDNRFQINNLDGYKGLLKLLPPTSRRGLILIDPSYEVKSDYETVVSIIRQAHRRFANGIYALWYPVVQRERIDLLETQLQKSGIRNIQQFELGLATDSDQHGMTASGMLVINPPWILKDKMDQLLPKLVEILDRETGAFYKSEVLVGE